MEPLLEIFKGLLTPVIAIIATYIAWQQWHINRIKLNIELYNRRLHVYDSVRKILSIVAGRANVSSDELEEFHVAVSEAVFLFGSEIQNYIDEIYHHGWGLWRWKQEYRDYTQEKPEGYDHQKVCDEIKIELKWFREKCEPAKEKFKKYLDISK